jgi:hypothetical protein
MLELPGVRPCIGFLAWNLTQNRGLGPCLALKLVRECGTIFRHGRVQTL